MSASLPSKNVLPVATAVVVAAATALVYCGAASKLAAWVRIERRRRLLRSDSKSGTESPSSDGNAAVSGLFIHPVKSLRAVSLQRASIDGKGLKGDRRFMVVSPVPLPSWKKAFGKGESTHRFMTQRQCPTLATVVASFDDVKQELTLTCSDRGERSVTISLSEQMSECEGNKSKSILAGIWGDQVRVVDMGESAANFLQRLVDGDGNCSVGDEGDEGAPPPSMYQGVRLVYHEGNDRPADDKFVPAIARSWFGSSPTVSLTDGFPILIACQASLDELNRRLKERGKTALPMSRFRPNIVISGTVAFEEDRWKTISIGEHLFSVVKACPRCKQSCTDQQTGEVTDEPLSTMSEFRSLGANDGDVFFAQNALCLSSSGEVCAGDAVRVLEEGEPVFE